MEEIITDRGANANKQSERKSLDEKLEKQTRTPRSYDAITAGAMLLELKDRVDLRNKLTVSIDKELADMKEKLQQAESIVNGKTEGL